MLSHREKVNHNDDMDMSDNLFLCSAVPDVLAGWFANYMYSKVKNVFLLDLGINYSAWDHPENENLTCRI